MYIANTIRENTNAWLWYTHTFLFNAFCQWNNLYLPFLTWILWWKTKSCMPRFRYTPGLEHWDLSDPFRDTVEYQTQFWNVIYFCIFLKMYGESWKKLMWWTVILQDSYRDQRDVLVQFGLFHFSHCSNQDYTEMTTSCRHRTDNRAQEFQPSMCNWRLSGDAIEVFLK